MSFDKRKLLRFCKLFGGGFCRDENVVLQTFTDDLSVRAQLKASKQRDKYAKVKTGGVQKNVNALKNLNNRMNAGVFFTVNRCDGIGRTIDHIVGINAIWCEFDKKDDVATPKFPLEPSIVVESSPGNFHYYWLVDRDNSSASDAQMVKQFGKIQARMVADWDSDKNAKDVSRVLRLPGFEHKKDPSKPFMVQVVGGAGDKYTWEKLKQVFPPYDGGEEPDYAGGTADGSVDIADADNAGAVDEFTLLNVFDPETVRVNGRGFKGLLLEPAILATILNGDKYIDPDDGYSKWLRVGICLYNMCYGGSEGFRFWLDWSRTSKDFDENECRVKWKSFGKKRDAKAGMGSLLYMARQGGYRGGYIDLDIPMMEEYIEAENWRKKVYLNRTVVQAVHGRDLNYLHKMYNSQARRPEFQMLTRNAMEAKMKLVLGKIPYLSYEDGEAELKYARPKHLIEERNAMCLNAYMAPIPGLISNKDDSAITVDEHHNLNTYLGLNINVKRGESAEAKEASKVFDFIHDVVLCGNDPNMIEYMRNWWSYTLQYPHKKAIVMPVFQGVSGIGKGTIIELFVNAFGQHATTITSENRLGSQFNGSLASSCIVYLNELSINKHETWSMVKAMLSDSDMESEKKGVDSRTVTTYFNMVLSTNNERVVATEEGDRRLLYLDVDDRFADDMYGCKKADSLYWNVIWKIDPAKKCGGVEAFLKTFLERDISNFDPKVMPAMEGGSGSTVPVVKLDNVLRTFKYAYHYLYELAKNDCVPLADDFGVQAEHKILEEGNIRVLAREDYEAYVKFATKKGEKYPLSASKFTKLKKDVGIRVGEIKLNYEIDGEKKRGKASEYLIMSFDGSPNYSRELPLLQGIAKKLFLTTEQVSSYFEEGSFEKEGKHASFALERKKELLALGLKIDKNGHFIPPHRDRLRNKGDACGDQQEQVSFRLRII